MKKNLQQKIDVDLKKSNMNITGNILSSFGTQINNKEYLSSDQDS